jgi:hypothetical protein
MKYEMGCWLRWCGDPVLRQISELLDDFDDDDDEEGPSGLLIPKYEFMYKQAIGTADAFLGMSHNKVGEGPVFVV